MTSSKSTSKSSKTSKQVASKTAKSAAKTAAKPTESAAKPGKPLSKADAAKVERLLDKVFEISVDKSPKAAIPTVEQALAITSKVGYADSTHVRVQERMLELLIEAEQTAAAKKLWTQLVTEWPDGNAAQAWITLAKTQHTLGTNVPPEQRDRVRTAWARGRLANVFRPDIDRKISEEVPEAPGIAYWVATRHLLNGNDELAKACIKSASEDDNFRERCEVLHVMWQHHQGKLDEAKAAFDKLLDATAKKKGYGSWESIAALSVLLGRDDAKTKQQILAAWKKSAGYENEDAIFVS